MRIGLIIYGSLDILTGGFIYDRKLVTYLRESGHSVKVFALRWRRYAGHLTDNFNPALVEQIHRADLDLLLQDELCHPSLFVLNRLIRPVTSAPIVSIVHHLRISEQHTPPLQPLYRAVEKQYLTGVDAWVLNSETTRREVEDLTGQTRPDVVAYPSGSRFIGLTTEQIRERVRRAGPLQIVYVGNVIPRKGLETLLNALGSVPSGSARLTVIGSLSADPGYTRAIKRQIRRLGIGEQIVMTGILSDDSLAQQLARVDMLVVPSRYEGFGIVYLEGMSFGLPAVATTAGAAHEIITPGVDGFLIPPGDSKQLAEALQQMISDRAQLMAMSLAARQRFECHPSWAETAARIEAFLQTL